MNLKTLIQSVEANTISTAVGVLGITATIALTMQICSRRNQKKSPWRITNLLDGSIHIKPAKDTEICDFPSRKAQYCVAPDGEIQIPVAKEGVASYRLHTINEIFEHNAKTKPDRVALQWECNSKPEKPLVGWTFKEYHEQIKTAARAYLALGLKRHDCVSIIGFNSKEWYLAELGAIFAGGKASGIYTTNGPQACEYIVSHSESKYVVCENNQHLSKFAGLKMPSVKAFITWGEAVPEDLKKKLCAKVMTWSEFTAEAAKVPEGDLYERQKQLKPGNCAVLIYTSGTTGNPKACMISHDNFIFGARAAFYALLDRSSTAEEHMISYLPLSHIAAQQLDIMGPAIWTFDTGASICTTFARPDALKGSLNETIKKVQPTIFFGVPRVFEKMMEAMRAVAAKRKMSPIMQGVVKYAKSIGHAAYYNGMAGGSGSTPWMYPVAKKLVFSKIYEALGFQRCFNHCYTGAAPISAEVLDFFGSIGIPIKEVFGMSETCGIGTVSSNNWRKILSCGHCVPGCEILLLHVEGRDPKGQGEICMRHRAIMMGYMKEEAKTKETIDKDGWLHSGDVGTVDEYGMVSITGRIKELLITAGGENVAPVPIEDAIKKELPCVSNVLLVGDRMKYNTVLITLKTKTSEDKMSNELVGPAKGFAGTSCSTVDEARKDAAYLKVVEDGIKKYNKEQAVSNAQKVQKFKIIDYDFTIAGGEMTGTLKVKRNVVVEKYKKVIEEMYQGGGTD